MVQRNRKQTRPIVKKVKQFYLNYFWCGYACSTAQFYFKKDAWMTFIYYLCNNKRKNKHSSDT